MIDVWEVVFVVSILILAVTLYGLGYSIGHNSACRKILERQQQAEAAERWKEVIEKLSRGGAV